MHLEYVNNLRLMRAFKIIKKMFNALFLFFKVYFKKFYENKKNYETPLALSLLLYNVKFPSYIKPICNQNPCCYIYIYREREIVE